MCRTIGCFMRMQGHGQEVGSLGELLAFLSQMGGAEEPEGAGGKTHEQFLQEAIKDQELNIKMAEIALKVLKMEPPETGAKLVALDTLKPDDPEKHGFATIATYELESGAFSVVGTDHLTKDVIVHTTPNIHGLAGLVKATRREVHLRSIASAEAKAAPAAEATA